MGEVNMNGADTAIVQAWIGGMQLHTEEQHIVGLQVNRKAEGVIFSSVLTVYDDTAKDLEIRLRAVSRVQFRYGWESRPSKKYEGEIANFRKEFRGNSGVTIRIEITSAKVMEATNPPNQNKVFENMTASQIANAVADQEGWIVLKVDPAIQVIPDQNKENQNRTFVWENETGMQFIRNKLQPWCNIPGRGQCRAVWGWDADKGKITFVLAGIDDPQTADRTHTYEVGGDDERVITWTPEFNWGVRQLIGSSKLVGEGIDKTSQERWKVVMKGTDSYDFENERILPISADDPIAFKQQATALWKQAFAEWGKATLTIVGTPHWNPNDFVVVVAYNKHGGIDPSSGTYRVDSGEDVITNGGFITTMHMTIVANYKGEKVSQDPRVIEEILPKTAGGTEIVQGTTVTPTGGSPSSSGAGGTPRSGRPLSDYSFEVKSPREGDVVLASRGDKVFEGEFINNKFIRVFEKGYPEVVTMKEFSKDATLSYRRNV